MLKQLPQPEFPLSEFLDNLLNSLATAPVPNGSLAEQAVDFYWRLMDRHDDYAKGLIRSCAKVGMKDRIAKHAKRDRGQATNKKGKALDIPNHVAVPVAGGGKQYRLWWLCTVEEFGFVTAEEIARAERHNTIANFYKNIGKFCEKHPDAHLVNDAFSAEGLDPQTFSLADIAS